jgi:uncharacterized protein YkwD
MKDLKKTLAQLIIMIDLVGHPRDQMVHDINTERGKAGLPVLYQNESLQNSASAKSNDMLTNNYWSHYSPSGVTPWSFMKNEGYNYIKAGENLARNFTNNKDMIKAWMDSPLHKANILNPNYQDIGTGTAGQYTVQHFGVTKKPTVWDYLLGRMK